MVTALDWSHETVLAAEPLSASKARDFVCLQLGAHDLPDLVDDIRLVVSELATNAVAHAQTPFVVILASANGSIRLTVLDESSSTPLRGQPDLMDMSGRGLMLVEMLSQAWGISTDANGLKSVWASFPADSSSPSHRHPV